MIKIDRIKYDKLKQESLTPIRATEAKLEPIKAQEKKLDWRPTI